MSLRGRYGRSKPSDILYRIMFIKLDIASALHSLVLKWKYPWEERDYIGIIGVMGSTRSTFLCLRAPFFTYVHTGSSLGAHDMIVHMKKQLDSKLRSNLFFFDPRSNITLRLEPYLE